MRRVLLSIVLAAPLAMLGCSGEQPAPSPSLAAVYRAQIDQLLSGNSASDLERSVLVDYWVTDAEMREAEAAFETCVTDGNPTLTVDFPPSGGYDIGPADIFYAEYGEAEGQRKFDDLVAGCSTGTVDNIQFFYIDPRRNPEGLTEVQLIRRCFDAHGVAYDPALSEQDFLELISGPGYEPSGPAERECLLDPYQS